MPRISEIQMRDPFVYTEDGWYYLTGSTDPDIWRAPGVGFDVYRGVTPGEFTEFEGPFPAFRPPAGFWAERNFWAPEVHRHRGEYFMFATFLPVAGRRGTAVLRADGPLGPFQPWSEGPVTPPQWECLDGTLFTDDAGDPWLVFCHEWVQVGNGEICAVRLTADLKAAAGEPLLLFRASDAPWPAQMIGKAPGSYVTDGPFLYRGADGRLSLLWSSYGPAGNYCIGEATSATGGLAGPWLQRTEPIYAADAGHGMLFQAPDGTGFLAIHTPNDSPNERPIYVEVRDTTEGLAVTGKVLR